MDDIFNEIKLERKRQDAKWGIQNHSPIEWCAILGEEVGEVNKAALEEHFAVSYPEQFKNHRFDDYRKELIQVAAVAVAMIECIDRNVPLSGSDDKSSSPQSCPQCSSNLVHSKLCKYSYSWTCGNCGHDF